MSIQTQLERIRTDKSTIRNKLVAMGLATSTDNLDKLATAIQNIQNHADIQAEVLEGSTYTIPKGYHNGSGIVIAKTDVEGDYSRYILQSKTGIIPSKEQQTVTSDEGNYGLSSVTIEPIPSNFQDISNVTATTPDVLAGKIFVNGSGVETTGTMKNNGAVSKTLDMSLGSNGQYSNASYTIPAGYHNGSGKVNISFEQQQSITPDDTSHTIRPTNGKVLSTVYVAPIPSDYVASKTQGTATTADILHGKTAYVNGKPVTGNIPVRSALGDIVVNELTFAAPAGYYADDIYEVAVDNNLVASNIKDGVTIFGVEGTFTDDASASAYHITEGYTAYVKGAKVTGTMPTYGIVEDTIEWTDFSTAPYYARTFQGYVTGVNVSVDTSDLEAALAEI